MSAGLAILGAGGQGAVALEIALACDPTRKVHVFDPDTADLLGQKVHPADPLPADHDPAAWQIHIAMGGNGARSALAATYVALGYTLETLIHPSAHVSPSARIGAGSVICPRAVVHSRAVIGEGVLLNTASVIEHDAQVADFTHISPGAVVAGEARVGARCWIGANAVVSDGAELAADVILGALSFAKGSLPRPGTYVGTPARRVE